MPISAKIFSIVLILIILSVSLAFRATEVNRSLAKDEFLLKRAFTQYPFPANFIGNDGQPVLYQLPYSLAATFFGTANWTFRSIPILAALITLVFLFLYLRKNCNFKIALLGIFLLAFLPWHIHASTHVHSTALLTLLIFLSLIFAEQYARERSVKRLLLAAVFSGLAITTMLSAAVVPIAISIYLLLGREKNITQKIKHVFAYGLITTAFVISLFALVYALIPKHFSGIFNHTVDLALNSERGFFGISLFSTATLLLWTGPFLAVFFYILLQKVRKSDIRDNIHLIFIAVTILIFLIFNSEPRRPFERYFRIRIPSMLALIAYFGKDFLEHFMRQRRFALIVFIAFFLLFWTIGSFVPHAIAPSEIESDFIRQFFALSGKILFPFSSNVGPAGFYVPGLVLVSGWIFVLLCLFLHLLSKKKVFITIALSAMLGFNLVVALYQIGVLGAANANKATDRLLLEIPGASLERTILVYRNQGITTYLPPSSRPVMFFYEKYSEEFMQQRPFSVILVNFPYIPENHEIWKLLSSCAPQYFSNDFNVKSGIYRCNATI